MEDNIFGNPNYYNLRALQEMSGKSDQDMLTALLRNLAISGQISSIDGEGTSGYSFGGRIGSELPVGQGLFRAGVTGQGYRANTPFGTFKDKELTGGDVGYKWNDKDVSLSYDQYGGTGGVPLWQLLFSKYF
jgi:hypothetical protein